MAQPPVIAAAQPHAALHSTSNTPRPPIDLSQLAHRRVIGFLGLFLPGLLYVIARGRPSPSLPGFKHLDSLSAYFYSGAVPVFVGVLFSLGLFLVTYRGYRGEIADRAVGCIAGISAILVGLFPTEAPPKVDPPYWWTPPTEYLHYGSAITLFICFILFATWLFRKSSIPRRKDRPPDKQVRNHVFLGCGIIMIASVAWAAYSLQKKGPIFWQESFAVWAFAISWLVKGEAHRPIIALARRMALLPTPTPTVLQSSGETPGGQPSIPTTENTVNASLPAQAVGRSSWGTSAAPAAKLPLTAANLEAYKILANLYTAEETSYNTRNNILVVLQAALVAGITGIVSKLLDHAPSAATSHAIRQAALGLCAAGFVSSLGWLVTIIRSTFISDKICEQLYGVEEASDLPDVFRIFTNFASNLHLSSWSIRKVRLSTIWTIVSVIFTMIWIFLAIFIPWRVIGG